MSRKAGNFRCRPPRLLALAAAGWIFCVVPAVGQTPAPAPYRALPAGTVLDYGSFTCTVEENAGFSQRCRGPAGEIADFFAKLVPYGDIPKSGYGSGMSALYCERTTSNPGDRFSYPDIESIGLDAGDRRTLENLWPLKTGNTASFRRNFRPIAGRARSTIRVTGTRSVQIQGKTRPVYELRGSTDDVICADEPIPTVIGFDETWLYSPDFDAVVRYEIKWRNTYSVGQDFAYELKDIRLPPAPVAASLPPAPFVPLPVGAELDYGSWKCAISAAGDFTHTCRGPDNSEVAFFGKLVPVGRIARSGYGTNMHALYCSRDSYINPFAAQDIHSVGLSEEDRQALRALWPLQVGKSATFRRNFRPLDGRARSSIQVTGTKSVQVQGRQLPVYVLNGRTTNVWCAEAGGTGEGLYVAFDEVWWYAPDFAAVVHYEIRWSDSTYPNPYSYDLASIRLPEHVPAARSVAPVALDRTAPEIEAPASLDTEGAIVEVAGTVRDASRIVEVTVNGIPVPVAADGSFSVARGVARGKSRLAIAAIDEWGNRGTREVAVSRTVPVAKRSPAPEIPRPSANPFADLHFGNYHALVIGNNRYKALPALRTAEADARAVADLLKQEYGFHVMLQLNATRSDVIDGLARMRATLSADDSLLVYYAGHGVVDRVTEQGYWLPVDADQDSPSNWVSTSDVTTMLRAIRARHVMVVADSCYSGTLVRAAPVSLRTMRERRAWIERVLTRRARTALVSGGLEPVLDGGGGGSHSVFARAFLDALKENRSVLEGEALFDAIKRPVALNSRQTPQYSDIRFSGHEGGDFLFVRMP